jgi:hypothetical protein
MEYLGYSTSGGKLSVSTNKVEAVEEWPVPKTQREVHSFVHAFSFWAKSMHHFSDLSPPSTYLLRKFLPLEFVMTPAPAGGAAAATAEGVRSQAHRHSPPPPRGGRW